MTEIEILTITTKIIGMGIFCGIYAGVLYTALGKEGILF